MSNMDELREKYMGRSRRHYHLLWLLAVVLVSCGGTTSITETPEAVHARWIAALRENDRTAALMVISPNLPQRELFVDQTLRTMQDLMASPRSPTGALQGVDLHPPTDQGQAKRAISIWRFAKKTWCYQTELIATTGGWRVVDWGQIAQCPGALL
jgi:hypothetical protein